MNFLTRVLSSALLGFLVLGAGDPPAGDIVAQQGSVRMTAGELKDALAGLEPATRTQVTATPQALAAFVRERLLNMSVLAEARDKGWDTKPEVVRRINDTRDAVILQTYLASTVPADAAFPTEAEVTAAYEANKTRLVVPRQFHIAQILLTVKPGATPEEDDAARKKANELRALAVRPRADFADLAKKNSQDTQSVDKGGDVGWLREPDMMPQVREVVTGMAENGVSQPVRVPDGWHILKLLETKPSGPVPLMDAKPQIVQALRQARAQKLMRSYLDEMVKARPIEVNEIELTKQVGPAK